MAKELYIYGFVAADPELNLGNAGIGENEIYAIRFKDVACVVSDSTQEEYVADKRTLAAHARILERIVDKQCMLPMQFGTVAPSEGEVISFMKTHRQQIKRLLKKLAGKVEIELEFLWKDMKPVFSDIARSNRILRKLRELPREKTRDELIMAGELVSRLLHERKEKVGTRFIKALKQLCDEYRVMPSHLDEMILNASFLVEAARVSDFEDAANKLADENAEDMRVRYIGPIAPCSFVAFHM